MLKKIATDWELWILLVFNIYLLDYYQQNPNEIKTLIFLYWTQSVFIGILTFFDLAFSKFPILDPATKEKSMQGFGSQGCVAFFFLFHYGFFHVGYLIFIFLKIDGRIDKHILLIGVVILAASLLVDFIFKKVRTNGVIANVNKTFFMPYVRIIPMHLAILLPEFLHLTNYFVFIALKILMDIIMHFVVSNHYSSHSLSSAP